MGKAPFPVEHYDTFDALLTGLEKKYPERPAVTTYSRGGKTTTCTYADLVQDAVSYTHLDVYKRQGQRSGNGCHWLFGGAFGKRID